MLVNLSLYLTCQPNLPAVQVELINESAAYVLAAGVGDLGFLKALYSKQTLPAVLHPLSVHCKHAQ